MMMNLIFIIGIVFGGGSIVDVVNGVIPHVDHYNATVPVGANISFPCVFLSVFKKDIEIHEMSNQYGEEIYNVYGRKDHGNLEVRPRDAIYKDRFIVEDNELACAFTLLNVTMHDAGLFFSTLFGDGTLFRLIFANITVYEPNTTLIGCKYGDRMNIDILTLTENATFESKNGSTSSNISIVKEYGAKSEWREHYFFLSNETEGYYREYDSNDTLLRTTEVVFDPTALVCIPTTTTPKPTRSKKITCPPKIKVNPKVPTITRPASCGNNFVIGWCCGMYSDCVCYFISFVIILSTLVLAFAFGFFCSECTLYLIPQRAISYLNRWNNNLPEKKKIGTDKEFLVKE